MTLIERLRTRIEADGPIPFEEYMAACLYDPEAGFFATGPLRSTKAGDFLTSPEVSPWFGRCLGRFAIGEYERLGGPRVFHVVDVGAGSGSLLSGMRHEIAARSKGHTAIERADPTAAASRMAGTGSHRFEWWAAEASPAARAHLEADGGLDAVVSHLAAIPGGIEGVIIANELLDNIPVALAVREEGGWVERWVDAGNDGEDTPFSLVPAPARPPIIAWADAFAGSVPAGGLVEVQPAAATWLEDALDRLARGAVVVIDYGGTAEELEPRRTQGTLRTYRAHHLGPDPLAEPGTTDVTVDVNFTALLAVAQRPGVQARLVRQDDFLTELGLRDELSRIRREELNEARQGDPMRRLMLRSERTDAETLLHPRGLGDFRVLVATKV